MDVLTQRYDNARSGANLQETVLTPAALGRPFGKLFVIPVDGHVYAQPLYVSGLTFPGDRVRNVLYVATMRNQVAAFDADGADTAEKLWQATEKELGPYVRLPDPNIGGGDDYHDIADAIGIVSTPVISRDLNVIYVVAMTHEKTPEGRDLYFHKLHALDLFSGAQKFGPVTIQGSVPGSGDGSVKGRITFTSNLQNQRPGLLLANGTIYVAFASYGDVGPYHGWVFRFDTELKQLPNIYNTTQYGVQGGIWMAGQGPAAGPPDRVGVSNVYAITGNGTFVETPLVNKVIPEVDGVVVTADGHPALAVRNQELLLAWRGRDFAAHHVNLARSSDPSDGKHFTRVELPDNRTKDGPALAFGNGVLYLAFTGNPADVNGYLNVLRTSDLVNFDKKTLDDTSASGPALAFGNGRLYLAWTGTDNRLNIWPSRDGQMFHPDDKVTLEETSATTSPALLFDGTKLFLLWSGRGNNYLNIAQMDERARTIKAKWTLTHQTSGYHPALARHEPGHLHLTWTGTNVARNLNHLFGDAPEGLGGWDTYDDNSVAAPALAVFGSQLFLSWTGPGLDYLVNLAELSDDHQLGGAFVKLTPDLKPADWFSPWNTQWLSEKDIDLGSSGALVLPAGGLIVGGGKEGKLYVLDPNNLGRFCDTCDEESGDTKVLQWWQATGLPSHGVNPPAPPDRWHKLHHIHGSPIFWHSAARGPRIFVWGEADWLRAFKFDGERFAPDGTSAKDVTTPAKSMPGGMLTISANGDRDGVIWASHPISGDANENVVAGLVRAVDADNLEVELWNSTWHSRDELGNCAKFTPPTVANGRVYVATFSNKICVYGPNPPPP